MSLIRFVAIATAVFAILTFMSWLLTPVHGAETVDWNIKTFATIKATNEPGAVAEIIFNNVDVNGAADNGTKELSLGTLTVEVTFTWDAAAGGADRITVAPPDGYMAIPDTLTLQEGTEGRLLIYPVTALGM